MNHSLPLLFPSAASADWAVAKDSIGSFEDTNHTQEIGPETPSFQPQTPTLNHRHRF